MKKLSLFILGTVILVSCGQEVAPTSIPPVTPVKTEAPTPVSEIPKVSTPEKDGTLVNSGIVENNS